MVEAMRKEMAIRKTEFPTKLRTIYFGGGTPSLLDAQYIKKLLLTTSELTSFDNETEITLEVNPDDVTYEKVKTWQELGINRISIGIQSFDNHLLKWMNRAHTADQAKDSIDLIRKAGIKNISIDFIYGIPSLELKSWEDQLHAIIELGIPHIACYALTVEPRTALETLIRNKKIEAPSDEEQALQFNKMVDILEKAGYEHYEISNFALPGWRSKHNSSYWKGVSYIGVGPSAHSFTEGKRKWNIANNALYLNAINLNDSFFEEEELDIIKQVNEYLLTSIRTIEGIDLFHVKQKWGNSVYESVRKNAEKPLQQDLLTKKDNFLQLSREGKFLADRITVDLMLE
jgi:oxygen-independent coproporphyrinogen-3 oxidase